METELLSVATEKTEVFILQNTLYSACSSVCSHRVLWHSSLKLSDLSFFCHTLACRHKQPFVFRYILYIYEVKAINAYICIVLMPLCISLPCLILQAKQLQNNKDRNDKRVSIFLMFFHLWKNISSTNFSSVAKCSLFIISVQFVLVVARQILSTNIVVQFSSAVL